MSTGRYSLAALLPRITPKRDDGHLRARLAHCATARGSGQQATGRPGGPSLPQPLVRALNGHSGGDTVFTADLGLPIVSAALHLVISGDAS